MKLLSKYLIVQVLVLLVFTPIRAQKVDTISLQLKWKHQFQFAGYYAAIEKGYYEDYGIQVKLLEAVEGQNPTEEVFNGNADFGVCTSDILLTHSQKKNAVVLATIFQHSPQILIASKKSAIDHVHDLIGKRIAMEPNAADIIAYMYDEGVPLAKCIIEKHSFNAEMLINGKIDAISAYSTDEPFSLKEAGFEFTIISPSMGGIDFYGEGLFTTGDFIKKNPTLVNNFREASLKGWKYAMDNPEEIIQLIYNKYSQRHSVEHLRFEAAHMINLIMADVVEIGYTNRGRWESIANTYKKLKLLDASFTTKGMLFADYQKPELKIRWDIIVILLLIILIFIAATYFFYNSSQKLKKEIRGRKKLESFLHESDEQYHILFANSPDANLIIVEGIFTDCNLATERILGCNRSQIIGKSPVFFSPEFQPDGRKSAELADEVIREALRKGKNTFEWMHCKFDGSEFLVEVSIGLMNIHGKPALLTTWRDISERRLSEELLKASETRFKTIFNEAPLGIALIDSYTGHIYEVNPMFAKIANRTLEEMANIDWMSITHPDDIQADLDNMATMNAGKVAGFQMEKRYLDRKGNPIWIKMTITRIDVQDKAHPRHLCMIEDITERKRAREEKRKIDDQIQILSLAIEQSPVTTMITDVNGNIEYANPKFTELTGYTIEQVIGQNPKVFKAGNKSNEEYKELWETILSGRSWHGVFQNKKKNGELYWESAIISPVKDEEGAITHFLAVKEDITTRLLAEEVIMHKSKELEELNADKDRFISILAHDLKNPFNTILGYLELLTENIRNYDIDKIEKQIAIINNTAQNTYNLLLDILLWARCNREKFHSNQRACSAPIFVKPFCLKCSFLLTPRKLQ